MSMFGRGDETDPADLDIERLRQDLMDYYGTAWAAGLGPAVMELAAVEHMTASELVQRAREVHFDLRRYRRR